LRQIGDLLSEGDEETATELRRGLQNLIYEVKERCKARLADRRRQPDIATRGAEHRGPVTGTAGGMTAIGGNADVDTIASFCRERRESLGLPVDVLAKRAHVSNRSIICVEGRGLPLDMVLSDASLRRKRAWTRILIRVAIALELPVDKVLLPLQRMTSQRYDVEEIRALTANAVRVVRHAEKDATWTSLPD
jgi:hypothetical protein